MQKRILLVDDEPAILKSLKRVLRRTSCQVMTAENGLEALKLLEEHNDIQVVVTDYRMPQMTGAQLLMEVKNRFPDVIGVILTGYADLDAVMEALNSGAVYQFLTKPWDEQKLLDTVQLAFEKSAADASQKQPPLGLEQLLSRNELMASLDEWLDGGSGATVFYLDVKNFHTFNDSLGYKVADRLLSMLAQSLIRSKPDLSLLGQMSGDEFLLIMPAVLSKEENQQVIRSLLEPFHELVSLDGRELHISFSVGYSVSPEDGDNSELLVRNAQAAVNYSKQSGAIQYPRYQPVMNEKSHELMSLRSDLYRALERNEFSVVYQPKVCIKTGNIVGAESLLRWKHESLGMVSPALFIPLAESTGLIDSIGEWVLSTACFQSQFWKRENLPLFLISVNLSGHQLQHNTLAEKVQSILQLSGISPVQLELEITESFLMQDIDNSLKQLDRMKELGIRLSIDDFGTGYSSLNYLSRLPIDTLKIDRSFVQELPESKERVDLVKNVIQMSHDLGMSVVAEGVETQAQLDILRSLNCDEIQGYFFSPPVSAEKFRILLESQPLVVKEFNS